MYLIIYIVESNCLFDCFPRSLVLVGSSLGVIIVQQLEAEVQILQNGW